MTRSAPVYSLRLLGRFTLTTDAGLAAPIRLAGGKTGALLAILAMSPDQAASREELAALLWDDRNDRQARHSLRQALLSLRRQLNGSETLATEGGVVRLRPDAWRVDATRFEELSRSSRIEDILAAAPLFRGDFLAGFDLDQEAFHEWAQGQRHRMQMAAVRLCEAALAAPLPGGEAAVAVAELLVAIDPLREDWQRLALRLYARCRGRHEALTQARAYAALLRRELGVEPEPATAALIGEIERGAAAPPPSPPRVAGTGSDPAGGLPVARSAPAPAIPGTASPRAESRSSSGHLRRVAPAAAIAVVLGISGSLLALHGHLGAARTADQSRPDGSRDAAIDRLVAAAVAAQRRGETVEALGLFEQALRQRPDHVPALLGVASQLLLGGTSYLLERRPSLDRAEQLVQRVLEIDAGSARAHHLLGVLQRVHRRNGEASLRSLGRALDLNPGSAATHAHIGRTLAVMRRLEEAQGHIRTAMRMRPDDPMMPTWLFFAGEVELELGNYEAARDALERSLALAPRNARVHGSLAAAYALMGDTTNAARHAAELKRLSVTRSFADSIHDSRGRGYIQPRLMDGLRLALAAAEAGALPTKGMRHQRFSAAGREVFLNSHSSVDDECEHNGLPVVTVLEPPAHGAVDTRELRVIVGWQRGRIGPRNCGGVSNLGIGVYYRPRPGFHGNDRVTYRVSFPSAVYFDDTFDIVIYPPSRSASVD
jgi:DNA-binding SARP family transcriptional activator